MIAFLSRQRDQSKKSEEKLVGMFELGGVFYGIIDTL